jgi:putative transposase
VDSVVVEADMKRKRYPTDLTDAEWTILDPLIPSSKPGGRPRKVDMREIMNAIFYVLRGGIAWRMMPHDLPACKSAYHYFRLWMVPGKS